VTPKKLRVAGVDGFRGGWVAIVLEDGRLDASAAYTHFDALLERLGDVTTVAVDIPIGLPDAGPRAADTAARAFVGPRRNSVFLAPPRPVLAQPTYAEARMMLTSLSAQAYRLRAKIFEVEALAEDPRVAEIHPEVSFAALAGRHLAFSKHSWNGHRERVRLLEEAGIKLPERFEAGVAGIDDVVDAAVAAWSAHRIATGKGETLPPGSSGRGTISY
jgi:predicted RNase H-like nuclease